MSKMRIVGRKRKSTVAQSWQSSL